MNAADGRILLAIAEAATPAGHTLGAPDQSVVSGVQTLLEHVGPQAAMGYRALLHGLDWAGVAVAGAPLHALDPPTRERALEVLNRGAGHWAVRAVVSPIKLARARDERLAASLGVKPMSLPKAVETKRWEQQIVDASTLTEDEEIEIDAVVVGTGAGGAPVARSLAAAGFAVMMLEEGRHHRREEFNGRPLPMHKLLYRDGGMTAAYGNTLIPLPLGRGVGGTTTINSGTCLRVPSSVHRRWQLEDGLAELRPGALDAYYDRVEQVLQVDPSPRDILGGCADVIARGCDALGYSHHVLPRNAPGCDGQGVCCFGCPTDAKRSTNISYVPQALERGAMVYTNARVTRILREGRRAVGVVAQAHGPDGVVRRITVRAKVVVLACGTIHTPALLLNNRMANSSGQVGRQLTIHPACVSWADFDQSVRGWEAVPQGYGIDEFADQGLRFEGAFLPPHYAAMFLGHVGSRWTDIVERFDHIAAFGFMVADTSRGRVSVGAGGKPRITYMVGEEDRLRMIRGHAILARVYFAAGARQVYPGMRYFDRLEGEDDVRRMEREGPDLLAARHIDISAYHPLGSCRMGSDARRSVIGPSHETHDVDNLFICDGSAVPGPLGVNPQMTIMAMSERASEHIARRIESLHQKSAAPAVVAKPLPRAVLAEFTETMEGSCEQLVGERSGERAALAFHVTALLPDADSGIGALLGRGHTWRLEGTLDWAGHADGVACHGSLLMRPLRGQAGLVYDLTFTADDGRRYALHGEKHLSVLRPVRGITTLFTEVRAAASEQLVAQGVLRFRLNTLGPWLASWRLGAAA
jgi:choline dehydrogenase-like flavoprotein